MFATNIKADLVARLRTAGLVSGGPVAVSPLAGGVSSDIHLVEENGRRFVVKMALPKLRVPDHWLADVSRNAVEHAYLTYARTVVPDAVPRVLGVDPEAGWFAMEYLDLPNWKSLLLAGQTQIEPARRAGEILGRLHSASWDSSVLGEQFSTLPNFYALRIEPYLIATAQRVPSAGAELTAEAARLAQAKIALVHGDYSPKNLLVSEARMVVLDAEVAWFGDPAFDTAFLLNHLHLKALIRRDRSERMLALAHVFWSSYCTALGPHATSDLEARTARLLLCLMLARVYGKSRAEYLTEIKQHELITRFVLAHLSDPPSQLAELTEAWQAALLTL